jgi:phosphoglycerate kinase
MKMAEKKSVKDVEVRGQTALVRVDFNAPFKPGTTEISDDSRIRASLPTLLYLLERDCRIVVCSHLGRPAGRIVESLRMTPVSRRLGDLLGAAVFQSADTIGDSVREMISSLASSEVLMLENVRFHPGEEGNDAEFARELASPASLYVNDAFGVAHRAHASTVAVTRYLPSVAGLLMQRELRILGRLLNNPPRPFAAILGGAKISDKIDVLGNLSDKVDLLLIGGGMAATFLKAQGHDVGESPVEAHEVEFAGKLITRAESGGVKLLLPNDVIVAHEFAGNADALIARVDAIPNGYIVMDIGPNTTKRYAEAARDCKTVMWNGPQGAFEWEAFSHGTRAIAETLASLEDATTVIGGGSTAEAVSKLGLLDLMTHVSSGGGASLEFMEGKELPGVTVLPDR